MAYSQNVTISPQSGRLLAGATYSNEVGFENGWSSLWRHNQLPLTLAVSDHPQTTGGGQLQDPAGNISLDTEQGLYVIMGGTTATTHMNISLPNGYRFTGYRIVMLNNINGKTVNNMEIKQVEKRVYETKSDFDTTNPLASTPVMAPYNDTKEYVIERTSKSEGDMTNNLYFYFYRKSNAFYGATVKSIELYFTAEGTFTTACKPASVSAVVASGVKKVDMPFLTGKLDLGNFTKHSKNGKSFFSYDYKSVEELKANNVLFTSDAVEGGKLKNDVSNGPIQVLQNGGSMYYALGNGTYYIESPVTTVAKAGHEVPLGYRITGASINYHYGTPQDTSTLTYSESGYYITYTAAQQSTKYYLQPDGKWKTDAPVLWNMDNEGHIYAGSIYLVYSNNQVNGVENAANPTIFSRSNSGKITYSSGLFTMYLTCSDVNSYAAMGSIMNIDKAASMDETSEKKSVENPSFAPGRFSLSLYGTNNGDIKAQIDVDNTTSDGSISVSGLNNDAVMFTVSGLNYGEKALLTFDVEMQALNPFINTLDIVCRGKEGAQRIIQTFTCSDFQVAGGSFNFYIPQDFTAGTAGSEYCTFSFENLYSKYMDATYGKNTDGSARNFFVKSAYYNAYGDGKQYLTTGKEEASTKVVTTVCGETPFKFNNSAELGNTQDNTEGKLEEYAFSENRYTSDLNASDDGSTKKGSFTDNIQIAVNNKRECYLFVGDETRFNIAPTSQIEHRSYAYYNMNIDLVEKTYNAECELKKVYDATCFSENDSTVDKPMYGATFHATEGEADVPAGAAYLSVGQMQSALSQTLAAEGAEASQVLYADCSKLGLVQGSDSAVNAFRTSLNPNAIVYLPLYGSHNGDNTAKKTQSGDFRSCGNIVITDLQPFYAPHKISVPAENFATYTRLITTPKNGQVANASVILPFTIDVDDEGVHTNKDGKCAFHIWQMNKDNCFSMSSDEAHTALDYYDKGRVFFSSIASKTTNPNTPYLVTLVKAPQADSISFTATQYGSDVMPTNGMNTDNYKYTYNGETASGTIAGTLRTYTNLGTYAGTKLNKEGAYFYFSGNMYVNSQNLNEQLHTVYCYPFRAFLKPDDGLSAKSFNVMSVAFGENNATTGIDDIASGKPSGITVTTGNGTTTVKASADSNVSVHTAAGVCHSSFGIKAGGSRTLALPSGVYIINGNKVIVK